ncbi:MAG: hypothetical protein EAZ97_10910 [Bacteroidetes bacterium]|nr:MAG: hypothetical protein EAZ97_10910 [Bacteroidota bacterium]
MTQKLAFFLIKALEIYAIRHAKDNKAEDYSLIYFSISSFGGMQTLVVCADWLYGLQHIQVLRELHDIFKNSWKGSEKLPMFSITIEKENIGNEDIDGLARLSKSLGQFRGYFVPTSNHPLRSGYYEEGYILKSKILTDFEFGKEFLASIRNQKGTQKLTPISFDQSTNEFSFKNSSSPINIFDIYEMNEDIEDFEIGGKINSFY